MKYDVGNIANYLEALPEERKEAMTKICAVLEKKLPKGFEEQFLYNMVSYVVPLSIYPDGYHCTPGTPLPFISVASQKNFIALYHMGLYCMPGQYKWFTEEYAKRLKIKLDMGKSCMRFKKPENIPYDLIGELAQRITVTDWITQYEKAFRKKEKSQS